MWPLVGQRMNVTFHQSPFYSSTAVSMKICSYAIIPGHFMRKFSGVVIHPKCMKNQYKASNGAHA